MNRIRANSLEFAYLEEGDGPLVVLLHGFPDTAHTWSHQLPAVAAAGYRAVAPYLRGYPPTEIPKDGFFDRGTLATDIAELIRALGGGGPVHLIGQDWGASITYSVLAAFPELIRRAVVMAVPHPARTATSLLDPKQVHRSFHWWFFQLPNLPERALAANDFAFVDYLWEYWSSAGYRDAAHIAEIRKLFYTMWERDKLGKVKPETIKETTDELASWVQKGHINQKQLIRFMAQVGYNTYKDDKKFMLPDGSNDNPILNPNSARVSLQFDSTQYDSAFWSDYKKWKKEHPALVDSINRATDSLMHRNGVPPRPKRK